MKYSYFRSTSLLNLLVLVIILSVLPSQSLHFKNQVQQQSEQEKFLKDSYNYFVTGSGNTVWAGALTLAWQQLKGSIIKEDITLDSNDKVVKKMVSNYNKSPFQKNSLSEKDYYIKSGYGQQTVTLINKQVNQKFPNRTFSKIDVNLKDQDIISYAYLAKAFEYPVKFTVINDFSFKNTSVKGFRAGSANQRNQVSYFYYENRNQFMIKLDTKNKNQGVYLLRTNNKKAKVKDIINHVNKWEKQPLSLMQQKDFFEMPVVDLDYNRQVKEIQGLNFLNEKFENYSMAKAVEGLKLKMDETGVKIENQGYLIMTKSSLPLQVKQPKYFILDDTFWIVLKENGKHPYLCIKINSPTQKQSL